MNPWTFKLLTEVSPELAGTALAKRQLQNRRIDKRRLNAVAKMRGHVGNARDMARQARWDMLQGKLSNKQDKVVNKVANIWRMGERKGPAFHSAMLKTAEKLGVFLR